MHGLRWRGKMYANYNQVELWSARSQLPVYFISLLLIFNSDPNSRVCRKKLPFLSCCFWLSVELNPQPTLIPRFLHTWRHPGASNTE